MTDQHYFVHRSVQESDKFFGRQTEVLWVTEHLDRGHRLLTVTGLHRIGKTAFLHELTRRLSGDYLAVYLDVAQVDDQAPPLTQVASQVGKDVREQGIDTELPETTRFAQEPLVAWQSYIDALVAQLEPRQLVLLVDNADQASSDWVPALLQAGLAALLTAESQERLAERLSDEMIPPPSLTLGPLDNDTATTLVKALVAHQAQIDPWAVRRVLQVTSNYPYYMHLFCRVLLECCSHRPLLMPSDVEEALKFMLHTPMGDFIVIWESSLPGERVVLSAFAALRGQGGIATQYDIQKSFARLGLSVPLIEIVATLDSLVQRGVLEKLGTNSYRFTLELLRLWVFEHHPPEQVMRREQLRFGRSGIAFFFTRLTRTLSKRRMLWISFGVVAVVVLVVVFQPGLWQRRDMVEPTPTLAEAVTSEPKTTPRSTPPATVYTDVPTAAPVPILPGYDLAMMSRIAKDAPWQIYAINSSTGKRLRLTYTSSNERTPKWSPDGRKLVFTSDRDGNREVYVMDLQDATQDPDNTQLINLTQHKDPDWQPAWSPDGKRVSFSSHRDQNWEIYFVDADGTNLVRITDHPENDFSPTWSPNGQWLLFVSRRRGNADLFILEVRTGEHTQLTHGTQDEYEPAWSPNGDWIAFVTQIGDQADVFVMRADGSDPVNITNSVYANDFQPTWTHDSEKLIFVSYTAADGDHDLLIMERDGSQVAHLTDDDNDNLAPCLRPIHSPAQ